MSVFINNFPESCSAKDLFNHCKQYGHIVDSFIPNKISKTGKRFGFVRFINVFNKERLVDNLATVWIGRSKLQANFARFVRPSSRGGIQVPSKVVNNAGSSNTNAVKVPARHNGTSFASVLQGNEHLRHNISPPLALVLDETCVMDRDFAKCVMGVKEVEYCSNDESLNREEVPQCDDNIILNVESDSDIDAVFDTCFGESGGNLDGDIAVEQPVKDGEHSSDPFGIYGILGKNDTSSVNSKVDKSLPFPPGFTPSSPKAGPIEQGSNRKAKSINKSVGSRVVQDSHNTKEDLGLDGRGPVCNQNKGGSVLELLDGIIKVERTMGFSMEGCEKDIESIIETKLDNISEIEIKVLWGNYKFDYIFSGSLGFLGGLLCVWDSLVFFIDNHTISDNFLAVYGSWIPTKTKLLVVSVYAPQALSEKRILWDYISHLISRWDGYSFTWSHPSASKMSRLDRFLVSDGFSSIFPNMSAICLDRHLSDHRPILLRDVDIDYGATPFCFYHSWLDWNGFDQFIACTWNSISLDDRNVHSRGVETPPLSPLSPKFQTRTNLIDIDRKLDQGGGNDDILLYRVNLMKQLHEFKAFDTREFMQKAKVQWAIEGDENSKFFHGILNKKHATLSVRGVMVDGSEKRILWDYLSHLTSRWDGECIVMGDFNEVRYKEERMGSVFNVRGASLFNDFIANSSLIDVRLEGYSFTWSHPSASKMSRLDRFLVSDGFSSIFPNMSAICLDRHLSDHRPILLRDVAIDYGATPFRFYHSRLEWVSSVYYMKWVSNRKHKNLGRINEIKANLIDIDRKLDQEGGNDDILLSRVNLMKQLHEFKASDTREFMQKAKVVNPIRVNEVFRSHFASRFNDPGDTHFHSRRVATPPLSPLSPKFQTRNVQTAFVLNRQILDGPFIVNELLDWCKRYKHQAMVFKVDFAKAYDSILWDYLIDVLRSFGFGDKWCSWIKGCLYSSMASILVNGSPTIEASLWPQNKWIPWPLIFSSLSWNHFISPFSRIVDSGLFKGINIDNTVTLSHLFYADDAIFIGEWSGENLNRILQVLHCFSLASRLKINVHKSQLLGVGIPLSISTAAASVLGCSVMTTSFKYLGVMVGGNMSRINAWDDGIQKLKSRLSKWKLKTLSIGGRLTLLKSVLGASPIYAMSIFKDICVADKLHLPMDSSFRRPVRGGGAESSQLVHLLEKSDVATRWVKQIPIKINIFAWRVFLDRLPSKMNLSRRGIMVNSLLCRTCNSSDEDVSHSLFSCPLAVDISRLVCRWWDVVWMPYSSYSEWLSWFKSIRMGSKIKGLFSWWCIWSFRNQMIFSPSKPRKAVIFDDITHTKEKERNHYNDEAIDERSEIHQQKQEARHYS
nr:RNA-directed DNA polymerase, eukaryota [Tanacetum cinerariifolium]